MLSPWRIRVSDPDARGAFRRLVESGTTLVVPGASSALVARLIEEAGYPATYVTGAGIANTYLGMPDIGLLSLTELAAHVGAMRNVVDTPLIVDADTGFGNAVNTWHTVRLLERAGASAIQIEDQTFPKRCGHFAGKSTVPTEEMVAKVRAAVDARTDPNLLIVARTDARAELGLAEACRRARAYRDAGADVTFVEAPQSEDEIAIIAADVPGPKVLNIVAGGRTPQLSPDRIAELGFAIVLYANLPLVVSMHAVRDLLEVLRNGDYEGAPPSVTWQDRQAAVRKPFFDELGDRYSPSVLAETPST
ncbi:MAG: carboxyvinyl-carboxyphosphonate phosphorylmutase [Mycobacterium sp.]|nr:carboxyvinyl-carboxyphosphonate phosphorylmutase [Mycobacterium sp.]